MFWEHHKCFGQKEFIKEYIKLTYFGFTSWISLGWPYHDMGFGGYTTPYAGEILLYFSVDYETKYWLLCNRDNQEKLVSDNYTL